MALLTSPRLRFATSRPILSAYPSGSTSVVHEVVSTRDEGSSEFSGKSVNFIAKPVAHASRVGFHHHRLEHLCRSIEPPVANADFYPVTAVAIAYRMAATGDNLVAPSPRFHAQRGVRNCGL